MGANYDRRETARSAFAAHYVITSSRQIKNGVVTGADVKDSSLTAGDIKDGSLTAADLTGNFQGPKGDTGPQGAQGPKGDNGSRGPSDVYADYAGDQSFTAGGQTYDSLTGLLLPDLEAYVAFANATVENTTGSPETVRCIITNGGPFIDEAKVTLDAGAVAPVTLMGISLQSESAPAFTPHIEFLCGGTGMARDIDIGALKIGSLH